MVQTGYGQFAVTTRPKARISTAHRLSYEFHVGPVPPGLFVLHKCHRRACFRPDHLYTGTALNNSDDMYEAGRQHERVKIGPITWNGETMRLARWAGRLGVRVTTLKGRLNAGWTTERILGEPIHIRTAKT